MQIQMKVSFFKLVISLEQGGKNKPLGSPPRLGLICYWFVLWSLAHKEVLNLLQTYVVVLTLGTHNSCN